MRGLRLKWRNPVLNKIGSLKTWNVFSGCLCVGRDGVLLDRVSKSQPETFAKPTIKQKIVTSVIPAQAGILVELTQWIVFSNIYECLARFPPARE